MEVSTMQVSLWLRSLAARLKPARRPRRRSSFRPRVEGLEDRVTPSTGGLLDPTFGSGGQVLSSFNNNDQANAVIAQPDGKIVIAGASSVPPVKKGADGTGDFLVARYNADGSLDTAFGSGGHTVTDFTPALPHNYASRGAQAYAVALQAQTDGTSKIVAAGMNISLVVSGTRGYGVYVDEAALARYNADGTLDTTFGTNGLVVTQSIPRVYAMAVDGSGRIVTVGPGGTVMRFTPNGALDTSFGTGGVLSPNYGINGVAGVVLQPDGKIVLAGAANLDPTTGTVQFVTARFNANGTADPMFGSGGVVTTHLGTADVIGGVTIQGDGKIVVSGAEGSGNSPRAVYLLRYSTGGSLDATFGTGGTVAVPSLGGQFARGNWGLAVQADGKIIAGGYFNDATGEQFAALRVNPGGSVDTGYGNGGWATIQFGNGAQERAIALEPDGRLLMAGYALPNYPNGPDEVDLVRFLGSAPQVGSFAASPSPVTAGSSVTLTASNIADGNPNSGVTQVAFYVDSNGDGVLDSGDTLLGYGKQSSPGVWTFTWSTAGLTAGSYTLFAQAQDSYGALGDPDAIALTVQ
jgi:uncharacterized delta-60 repeat protein